MIIVNHNYQIVINQVQNMMKMHYIESNHKVLSVQVNTIHKKIIII